MSTVSNYDLGLSRIEMGEPLEDVRVYQGDQDNEYYLNVNIKFDKHREHYHFFSSDGQNYHERKFISISWSMKVVEGVLIENHWDYLLQRFSGKPETFRMDLYDDYAFWVDGCVSGKYDLKKIKQKYTRLDPKSTETIVQQFQKNVTKIVKQSEGNPKVRFTKESSTLLPE